MWKEVENNLQKNKHIAPLIQKWGSCTIAPINKEKYFEDLVDAICSQQLSIKAAKTIFERVKSLLVTITPETVLNKSDQEFRDCGLSWQKASYVKDLATKVKEKEVDLSKIQNLSDSDVISTLVKVKGIGKWTAEMFLMFSLARPDVFPLDDLGIQKGFEKVTNIKWDKKRAEKFATKHWSPYRTVASWYLWRSLENG